MWSGCGRPQFFPPGPPAFPFPLPLPVGLSPGFFCREVDTGELTLPIQPATLVPWHSHGCFSPVWGMLVVRLDQGSDGKFMPLGNFLPVENLSQTCQVQTKRGTTTSEQHHCHHDPRARGLRAPRPGGREVQAADSQNPPRESRGEPRRPRPTPMTLTQGTRDSGSCAAVGAVRVE